MKGDPKDKKDVVIVSAVRTPFSKFGGVLKDIHSIDLAAFVIKEALRRANNLDPGKIDELYYGMCILSEGAIESNVNARQALLRAGMPATTISLTIDRACCSSLTAVQLGMRAIRLGEAEMTMAVGTDNMSNTPFVLYGKRWATGLAQPKLKDHLYPIYYTNFNSIAQDAGEVALEYDIGREEQDKWALSSQQRWAKANEEGKFKDEIMTLKIPQKKGEPIIFDTDEFPKPWAALEGLSKLSTVYGSPTVTAGNAPGLDAGSAAIILMTRERAEKEGLKPLAKIHLLESVCGQPREVAIVPGLAMDKAITKANFQLDDIDLIEINEAFAAMPLVSSKILNDKYYGGDEKKLEQLRKKINVNGGAIAIGHPVGASGARILMTLMYELRRRKGRYGACAICGGLAQGDAAIIEVK